MAELLLKKKQVSITIDGHTFKVKKSMVEMQKDVAEFQKYIKKLGRVKGANVSVESMKLTEKLENLITSAIGEDSLEIIGDGESLDYSELTQIFAHIIQTLGETQKKGISDFVKNYE